MKRHCAVGEAGGGAGDAGEEMQCWVGSDGGARTGRMSLASHEGQRNGFKTPSSAAGVALEARALIKTKRIYMRWHRRVARGTLRGVRVRLLLYVKPYYVCSTLGALCL